jgi:hypothetical protein
MFEAIAPIANLAALLSGLAIRRATLEKMGIA